MHVFEDTGFHITHRSILYSDPIPFQPHCNSIEMVRSGHVRLETEYGTLELQAPVLFWMHQGHHYRFIVDSDSETRPCDHLCCDIRGVQGQRMADWLDELFPEHICVPSASQEIAECFFYMLKYYRLGEKKYKTHIFAGFARLLQFIEDEMRSKHSPVNDPHGILNLSEEIRKNPFQNFDFHAIAAKQEVTYTYFRLLFRKEHHMTPPEYVRKQRMINAADLLIHTRMRIKEIMYSCNYGSLMEFSRTFKRYFGMSPREYRSKNSPQS